MSDIESIQYILAVIFIFDNFKIHTSSLQETSEIIYFQLLNFPFVEVDTEEKEVTCPRSWVGLKQIFSPGIHKSIHFLG